MLERKLTMLNMFFLFNKVNLMSNTVIYFFEVPLKMENCMVKPTGEKLKKKRFPSIFFSPER